MFWVFTDGLLWLIFVLSITHKNKSGMSFSQTKEFYDLMCEFEKIFAHKRLDREEKPLWIKQHYYQDGSTNDLFCAYLYGYQNGRSVYM